MYYIGMVTLELLIKEPNTCDDSNARAQLCQGGVDIARTSPLSQNLFLLLYHPSPTIPGHAWPSSHHIASADRLACVWTWWDIARQHPEHYRAHHITFNNKMQKSNPSRVKKYCFTRIFTFPMGFKQYQHNCVHILVTSAMNIVGQWSLYDY